MSYDLSNIVHVPREARKPPKPGDDAAWRVEALRLLLVYPRIFRAYRGEDSRWVGYDGLKVLGFIPHNLQHDNDACVNYPWLTAAGRALVVACGAIALGNDAG